MKLEFIDWTIVVTFFVFSLAVGLYTARSAGKDFKNFFLSGRNMPWWLLGVSMVATTFSSDTPNLVTDIVRQNGVSGNWVWWAFLLTGMLTVFIYARLWRKSEVFTDLEFYELRYSGKEAAFLRGFRAIYLGFFFNVMIMASVSLAAIKIGGVLLGLSPVQTILIASIVTVIYSSLGGLKGVLITDFFQFIIAMIGAVGAAIVAINLPEVDGLSNLISHPNVADKINFLPDFNQWETVVPLFIIPIAVQWWSVWYPGAEPGGGGYIAQRMLSAKDENNAAGATFLFNAAHYALRPWPWIIVALASLIIYPDLESLKAAYPDIDSGVVRDDLAYPAMLGFLPTGLLGIVVTSLIAAYMSTISTHLNWGSSYIVHDFYERFFEPEASEKKKVLVGRISTIILMVFAGIFALILNNALQAFNILLQIGAGTGLIFILRWFWWRINAWTEITAMIVSFVVAIYFEIIHPALGLEPIPQHIKLVLGVLITSIAWITVAFLGKETDEETLKRFYLKVKPGGPGWKNIREKIGELPDEGDKWNVPNQIMMMVAGTVSIYTLLFGTGYILYGNILPAILCFLASIISGIYLFKSIRRI